MTDNDREGRDNMKTTVKHVGSVGPVREWEGPIENWEAHEQNIKHWCDGGDIEDCSDNSASAKLLRSHLIPLFSADREYRIKQREPVPGEVWVFDTGRPFVICGPHFIMLDGSIKTGFPTTADTEGFAYSAPSVEAYYARKFKKECDDNVDLELEAYSVIEKACNLGGE